MAEIQDSELEAIRAKRMSELQTERQGKEGEEKARMQEMQNMLLSQILTQDARARLNSIALVKPERAKMIETNLLRMAQSGQVGFCLAQPIRLSAVIGSVGSKISTTEICCSCLFCNVLFPWGS